MKRSAHSTPCWYIADIGHATRNAGRHIRTDLHKNLPGTNLSVALNSKYKMIANKTHAHLRRGV